jgi:CRP-like cAMP-binding protein
VSPELKIYDKLLQFPLFQGMSHTELMQVVAHTKMDFVKYATDKKIVLADDACTHLFFLINGTLEAQTTADDRGYSVIEQLTAPYIIQPERLFGIQQRYTSSFKAISPCHFITIDKQEVMLLLDTQLVFRLNMLNLMATEAQRVTRHAWRPVAETLRAALIRFFIQHTLYPAGPKMFHILMKRLAEEMNCSRLDVSTELNKMQKDGLVTLHRGRVEIPMLERLLM